MRRGVKRMLCRFKDDAGFRMISWKTLAGFLKVNADRYGKLDVPFEVIQAGYLAYTETDTSDGFPWIFSTYDTDRFDERVDPDGWELDRYRENPVVLWAHCHSIPAIGLATDIVASDTLCGTIRFNEKDYDEFGWSIGERVKNGVIRAGSVGMLVKEIEFIDKKKSPEETCELIIRKQELIEFSLCNVPANPFALRKESRGEESSPDNRPERTCAPTACSPFSGYWPLINLPEHGGMDGRREDS